MLGIEQELIQVLLDNNLCSKEEIERAKDVQSKLDGKICTILMNSGILSEDDYLFVLSKVFSIDICMSLDKIDVSLIEIDGIERDFFKTYDIYPFNETSTRMDVFISSNLNYDMVFYLQKYTDKEIKVYLTTSEIINELKQLYMNYDSEDSISYHNDEDIEKLKELASEAPVIKMINNHFNDAIRRKSSDIHYESDKSMMKVRFRIDGVLQTVDTIPLSMKQATIARLKLLAKMNISENRLPQDGRISIKAYKEDVDIRVSSVPTAFGESFVLRLLGKQAISYDLNQLNFFDDHIEMLKTIIANPHGVFLTTGPTGSGKTTTLYSLLNYLNNDSVKIISVEDPVEYQLDGISQIQVKNQIDFTFAKALRSILRQDPDIIMVGEIRDEETAKISIQSALTGHLVLSTLHTNSALGAITRLIDMGIEYFLLKSSINGLMAQRLVRSLCSKCKEPYTLSEYESKLLNVDKLLKKYPFSDLNTYKKVGCKECNFTGYKGRLSVAEIVPFDDNLQKIMENNKNFNDLESLGYRTIFEDATLKFLSGKTTIEEILKVKS